MLLIMKLKHEKDKNHMNDVTEFFLMEISVQL